VDRRIRELGCDEAPPRGALIHEEVEVHRGADRLRLEAGLGVEETCRKLGVSQAKFFRWEVKYGELGTPELRRLRLLEEEDLKLKQPAADLSLDKRMLQDVLAKKT